MTPEMTKVILETVLIPLLSVLTGFLAVLIRMKTKELEESIDSEKAKKYVNMLSETITQCVIATNQTYANALKEAGSFDEAAQREAFDRTYKAVMDILSAEAKEYLDAIYGDLSEYLTQKIESEVFVNKLPH